MKMNARGSSRPLIRQGWLRVVLFLPVYILPLGALGWGAATIIRRIVGGSDAGRQRPLLEYLLSADYLWLISALALISTFLLVFLFRRLVDRKTFYSLGFRMKGMQNDAAAGFFLAPLILGCGTLILYFSRHLAWTDIVFDPRSLFISGGTMVFIAMEEELAFRGYILNNLMDSFGGGIALVLSSALFAAFHLANANIGFLPLVNIFLAGLLLGVNYIYTRNLWFGIMLHFAWNFLQGPLLGYKVSGIALPSLIQTDLQGGVLLTGGPFGFEGSILCSTLVLTAFLLLYWAYHVKYGEPAGHWAFRAPAG